MKKVREIYEFHDIAKFKFFFYATSFPEISNESENMYSNGRSSELNGSESR
jgi:hypothetical protein